MSGPLFNVLMPAIALLLLGALYILIRLMGLWLRARSAGAPVPIARIVRMALLRINPKAVVDAYTIAATAGVDATLDDIESHAHMSGRLQRTVVACAAAKKAGVEFPFAMARAMDITGRDAMEVAQDLIRAKREGERAAADSLDAEAARAFVGKDADVTVAVTPPGMVTLEGQRVNAMCSSGYIKKGAKVRIVSVKDNMALVEPVVETYERTNE